MAGNLTFAKFHGLGNDFVVVDARSEGQLMNPETASQICDRRRGVGADGVLTILPPRPGQAADVRMHIYNADGTVPEMCGNGLRCVIKALGPHSNPEGWTVDTDAGLLSGWLEDSGEVRVTLGKGRVLNPSIPVQANTVSTTGVEVDLGNPHLVIFTEEGPWAHRKLEELADAFGPELEYHPRFPERVNVGFARFSDNTIHLVVFERGVGRTEACGTGAAASALAAQYLGKANTDSIRVVLPGGPVVVDVPTSQKNRTQLIGPAVQVFSGTYPV